MDEGRRINIGEERGRQKKKGEIKKKEKARLQKNKERRQKVTEKGKWSSNY